MYEELRGLSGLRARGVGRVYGSRVGFRVVGFRVLGLASTVFLFWMWVFYRCVFLVVSALLAAGTSERAVCFGGRMCTCGSFFVAVVTGCLFKRGCLLRERGTAQRHGCKKCFRIVVCSDFMIPERVYDTDTCCPYLFCVVSVETCTRSGALLVVFLGCKALLAFS